MFSLDIKIKKKQKREKYIDWESEERGGTEDMHNE